MNRLVIAAVLFLACAPTGALAQSRGSDAALGAISGAVVFGPVGAVAGALVGYTAGPAIARSWGTRGSSPPSRQSRVKARAAAPRVVESEPAPPASASPARVQTGAAPPVQSLE
jgi:hypothetical protein